MSFFDVQEPSSPSPVLVNIPHAGTVLPAPIKASMVAADIDMLRDADFAVDRLFARAPELGAGLIRTSISRFVVDLNRHPDDIPSYAVDGPTPLLPEQSYGRRGLFWLETTRGVTVVDRPLTSAEVEARLAYYTPVHERLQALLQERVARFGMAMLIDGHSMPSVGHHGHADAGVRRADVVLGDNDGLACGEFFVAEVERVLVEAGLSVVRNVPYKGGYDTGHYGRPQEGVHALQIELNRALYMDEERIELRHDKTRALATVMDRVVEAVVRLSRAR